MIYFINHEHRNIYGDDDAYLLTYRKNSDMEI